MNFCIIKINYDFAICVKYFPQQQPPTHFYIIDLWMTTNFNVYVIKNIYFKIKQKKKIKFFQQLAVITVHGKVKFFNVCCVYVVRVV